MHPADIKAVIQKRGITEISRIHGYFSQVFVYCLRYPYRKVERLLSEFLGIPLHVLFPKRWDASGKRLVKPGRPGKETIGTKTDNKVNRKRERGRS